MSPRKQFQPNESPLFTERPVRTSGRLSAVISGALAVSAAAIALCALTMVSYEKHHRMAIRDVIALNEARSFMTMFTSPDPYHANDYVDHVVARATGDFATEYQSKINQILVAIARSEPTTGTVLDAGIERWNDDGSATVMVVMENQTKSEDGKKQVSIASRWLITTQKEGDQWKISHMAQVI